eukprot:286183_1
MKRVAMCVAHVLVKLVEVSAHVSVWKHKYYIVHVQYRAHTYGKTQRTSFKFGKCPEYLYKDNKKCQKTKSKTFLTILEDVYFASFLTSTRINERYGDYGPIQQELR